MNKELTFGRFDDPLKDYSKAVRKVKTFAEMKSICTKYKIILDDATDAFEQMNELSFQEFISQLPKCYGNQNPPPDKWMEKYAAIILPKLFIEIINLMSDSGMPSGFIFHRLIEAGLAEVKDGRFYLQNDTRS